MGGQSVVRYMHTAVNGNIQGVFFSKFAHFVFSLPQLIEIVGRINVTSSTCVHEFSRFFWRFCRTFGKIFTSTKVKPLSNKCKAFVLSYLIYPITIDLYNSKSQIFVYDSFSDSN